MTSKLQANSLSDVELDVFGRLGSGNLVPANLLMELSEQEDKPMLVESLLPKAGLVALVGPSDTGKSSLLLQLATAIVTNESQFLSHDIHPTTNRCIYVATEDDPRSIGKRLSLQHGKDSNSLGNLQFLFSNGNLLDTLYDEIEDAPVDCIIIDSYGDAIKGDTNQSSVVREFLHEYRDLALTNDCLVIFLHHLSKRKEESAPSKNNILGSQSFEAKLRLVLELRNDRDDLSTKHLTILKGNEVSNERKVQSMVLKMDERLRMHFTGKTVSIDELGASLRGASNDPEVIAIIKELHYEGKSTRQIVDELSSKQVILSKSSVDRVLQKLIKTETFDFSNATTEA